MTHPPMRFEWTFNAGHVMQVVAIIASVIGLYYGIREQLATQDRRISVLEQTTAAIPELVTETRVREQRIGSLEVLAKDLAAVNRTLLEKVGQMQADLAVLKDRSDSATGYGR